MKAILVLDEMPCACAECPLCVHAKFDYYFDEHICTANGQEILDDREVHRMCPLLKIPDNAWNTIKEIEDEPTKRL